MRGAAGFVVVAWPALLAVKCMHSIGPAQCIAGRAAADAGIQRAEQLCFRHARCCRVRKVLEHRCHTGGRCESRHGLHVNDGVDLGIRHGLGQGRCAGAAARAGGPCSGCMHGGTDGHARASAWAGAWACSSADGATCSASSTIDALHVSGAIAHHSTAPPCRCIQQLGVRPAARLHVR